MTYIVTDNCIRCKYTDCVEVCPVDCFYEGENFLVIHPDECIDCGVCEPECPAEAIKPDTEPGLDKWLKINADYAKIWPNITVKKDPDAGSQGNGRRRRQVRASSSRRKSWFGRLISRLLTDDRGSGSADSCPKFQHRSADSPCCASPLWRTALKY